MAIMKPMQKNTFVMEHTSRYRTDIEEDYRTSKMSNRILVDILKEIYQKQANTVG